ncbi:hypothetical protein EPI10_005393 [Gossypium australe]|uniref:Uncharacterized protein n=1 Tax=Gossypium australe TaxID=47621 RepID=A0A5B6WMX0_9ROSI|nr:hypothetical protein EPI10_005393 [Gossypium australe]
MTGYVSNDQLLIHCFQDSLIGAAAKWYNQLRLGIGLHETIWPRDRYDPRQNHAAKYGEKAKLEL